MELALPLIIFAYIVAALAGYILDYINIRHLERRSGVVPPEFEGRIEPGFMERSLSYLKDHSIIATAGSLVNNIVLLAFLLGGFVEAFDAWVYSLGLSFIQSGLVFFMLLFFAELVIGIPFSLYSTFRVENRYGFNTMGLGLWIADLLKSTAVSAAVTAPLLAAGLWIVKASPDHWWFWAWGIFFIFSIFMMYISPYVIEPLFNKFEPVEGELAEDIRRVMERAGLHVKSVFKIDSSKRTRHTNAYFTGIGRVKRIVLYDTLFTQLTKDELLSVLAHEAGHWKKKHVLKMIAVTEALALAALYIAFRLLEGDILLRFFGFEGGSFFMKLFIAVFLGSLIALPLGPAFNYLSRRNERQADEYAVALCGGESMAGALIKLSKDNLANLFPHPLYAKIYYSHPPVLERIRMIRKAGRE